MTAPPFPAANCRPINAQNLAEHRPMRKQPFKHSRASVEENTRNQKHIHDFKSSKRLWVHIFIYNFRNKSEWKSTWFFSKLQSKQTVNFICISLNSSKASDGIFSVRAPHFLRNRWRRGRCSCHTWLCTFGTFTSFLTFVFLSGKYISTWKIWSPFTAS